MQEKEQLKHEIIAANLPKISGKVDISQADPKLKKKVADFIEKTGHNGGSLKIGPRAIQYISLCVGPSWMKLCIPMFE